MADTFHTTDGKTLTGEIVSADDTGFILKEADGNYTQRNPWTKLTQDDLKELLQNPKAAPYVQPFIEQAPEEKMRKTEVEIKDFTHLSRPPKQSLFKALLTSTMGLFILLICYGANLYGAYEIAIFRGHPVGLVCGVSAVLPIIGPSIFLCISKRIEKAPAQWANNEEPLPGADEIKAEASDAATATADASAPIAAGQAEAASSPRPGKAVTSKLPPAKKFARGQFTFNRRFFETQMPGFFAVSRPEAIKDDVIGVKSSRGDHVAHRIPRINATEVTFQVNKGNVSEEVTIPFVEIQEIQIRHKDAPAD